MENRRIPWYKKWWGVLLLALAVIFFSFLTAFVFYFVSLVKNAGLDLARNSKGGGTISQNLSDIEGAGNYWFGSAKPRLTIVEFADFVCPYSKNSFPNMREIGLKYQNNVKIIFRDYPLRENSVELAMAGRCAGEQGLFWLMHDKLFQNQDQTAPDQLTALANQIGADTVKFKDCLVKQKYLPQIQKDFTDAEKLKLKGTPTWFFNGQKVEGDMPYEAMRQIVEKMINN